MTTYLNSFDYSVIITYLLVTAFIGLYAGRREKNTEDYFLAGRSMPWWLACLSILATEISAMTFIGTPEEGFRNNYLYLQFAFGSLVGRYLIAYILIPGFFERKIGTIYEYLKNRFGFRSHILSSIFFFITRIMASGVRLYTASLAIMVTTGWPLWIAIAVMVILTTIFTAVGGLKAVMWTDVIQVIVFFGGAFAAVGFLLHYIPGGFFGVMDQVRSFSLEPGGFDKLKMFNFSLNLSDANTFLVSVLFGCFMTFAAIGADQDLAQKLLTCDQYKKSQKAIITTAYIDFPVVLLFLFIGTCLFAFFRINPEFTLPDKSSHIFPYFIVKFLPHGLIGLLISSVMASAISSLDSTFNALSSSAVLDIYKPYFRKKAPEQELLFVSRFFTVFFALLLVAFAFLCQGRDGLLFLGFKLVSFTYGALLGVFCLGILTKRGSDRGNVIAMITSTAVVTFIHFYQTYLLDCGVIQSLFIGWSWYIIIGSLLTFLIGFCFNTPKQKVQDVPPSVS